MSDHSEQLDPDEIQNLLDQQAGGASAAAPTDTESPATINPHAICAVYAQKERYLRTPLARQVLLLPYG